MSIFEKNYPTDRHKCRRYVESSFTSLRTLPCFSTTTDKKSARVRERKKIQTKFFCSSIFSLIKWNRNRSSSHIKKVFSFLFKKDTTQLEIQFRTSIYSRLISSWKEIKFYQVDNALSALTDDTHRTDL